MKQCKLGEMEQKFANLIWENAPIATGELVKLCEKEFNWKRTTTYTMLKRLCERNLFENENGVVVVRTKREDYLGAQGEQFLEEHFEGSLPSFLVAFTKRKKLCREEIQELKKIIEDYGEDE